MILVDASVWIDFFNGNQTAAVGALSGLLADAGAPLAVADLTLFEVLRGFRHEQDFLAARRALAALPVVEIGGEDNALRASAQVRSLRARGRTVHSPVDVLIACWCIENQGALLHSDRDFDAFEQHAGLRIWRHFTPASERGHR
ncbi:MAG: PIN domain-containing protein [Rubrivivax sp.]